MFTPGQRVVCVRGNSDVKAGRTYVVTRIEAGCGCNGCVEVGYEGAPLVELEGVAGGCFVWRFKPATDASTSEADPVLPTGSEERKGIPVFSGVLNYFPLAVAAVSRLSKRGNDKHNPGEPLHWARGKSTDHADCIARHLIDVETLDPKSGEYEDAVALAWRALALLQEMEEKRLGKPYSRGSR